MNDMTREQLEIIMQIFDELVIEIQNDLNLSDEDRTFKLNAVINEQISCQEALNQLS